MKALKSVVSMGSRGGFHAAAIFVLGCSAGVGDSTGENDDLSSGDGVSSSAQVAQDLRGHSVPRLRPHPARPQPGHGPHHPPPGHGHGASSGGTPSSGSAGSAGSAGSVSGGEGGFVSGAGGASSAGSSGSGFGGAPFGGFTSTGGASNFPDPCGDGVQFFNACDDGNTVSGDGCSETCDIEPGYACEIPGTPCRQQRCGDGFQDYIFVPGDPTAAGGSGGAASGTGGAAGGAGFGSYIYEGCDDGNTTSGDGCSATCDLETGYICDRPGTSCRQPRCGDGFQDFIPGPGDGAGGAPNGAGGTGVGGATEGTGGSAGGGAFGSFEGCDDGNATSGDGCSSSCELEAGYICFEPNTPCRAPRCGDGVIDYFYPGTEDGAGGATGTAGGASAGFGGVGAGGDFGAGGSFATGGAAGGGGVEQCDDGNTESGDGCSATCQAE
jgi:cysteine-rich repeat protein